MATGDGSVGWLSGSEGVSVRHRYARPEWVCQWCGQQWPCPWARAGLLEEAESMSELGRRMAGYMHDAAWDLAGRVTAEQLWERFLGWLDDYRERDRLRVLPAEPAAQPWWRPS